MRHIKQLEVFYSADESTIYVKFDGSEESANIISVILGRPIRYNPYSREACFLDLGDTVPDGWWVAKHEYETYAIIQHLPTV